MRTFYLCVNLFFGPLMLFLTLFSLNTMTSTSGPFSKDRKLRFVLHFPVIDYFRKLNWSFERPIVYVCACKPAYSCANSPGLHLLFLSSSFTACLTDPEREKFLLRVDPGFMFHRPGWPGVCKDSYRVSGFIHRVSSHFWPGFGPGLLRVCSGLSKNVSGFKEMCARVNTFSGFHTAFHLSSDVACLFMSENRLSDSLKKHQPFPPHEGIGECWDVERCWEQYVM